MANLTIHKTGPSQVYEDEILIQRDMDLPYSVQLFEPDADCGCDEENSSPYSVAGHEFIFEIFKSKESLEALIEFDDEDWERDESPDQDDSVEDIVKRNILWTELSSLDNDVDYWYRFYAIDAVGIKFLLVRGTLRKETH